MVAPSKIKMDIEDIITADAVVINDSLVPPSKTLAQMLQRITENICSVAPHTKRGGNEKGDEKVQRGDTSMIMREELRAHVTTSGVNPSSLRR